MSIMSESTSRPADTDTKAATLPVAERAAPPTRLLQILKALEVEAASDVNDILRRSRATFR